MTGPGHQGFQCMFYFLVTKTWVFIPFIHTIYNITNTVCRRTAAICWGTYNYGDSLV